MADGYIIIDTSIQTKGFEEGTKSLEQACRNAANSIQGIGDNAKAALNKSVDAFAKKNAALAQQQKKVADAQKEVDALSGKQVETPEFSGLNREIERLEASLERVSDKRVKFLQTGGNTDSKTFAGIEYDLDHIGGQLDSLTAKKTAMLEGGTAYTPADTSGATAKLEAEQAKLSQMNRELNTSFDALNAKFKKYGASISGASGKMGVFATLAQRIKGVLANVANAFRKTSDGANKFGNSVNKVAKNTKRGFLSIAKNTAVLSLLYSALFAVRNAITQGFRNLAQASAPTNKSISSLVSALTQLKNAFATAFAPVLNVVVPILNTLISAISRALSAIGRFLAALTGKKTFMQATAVQEDYAASLGATGSAAGSAAKELKELQNLSGLDEINTFQTAKDTGSSGGGGGGGGGSIAPSDMFEEVEISPKLLAFAEKVKSLFGGIVERVKQFGRDIAAETKTWFSNLDFGPISRAFEGLVEAIEPFVDVCLDGLEWVYTNILLPLGKWTIEKGAPVAIDLLTGALELLTGVAEKLGNWGKKLWDNFLKPIAEWTGDAVVAIFEKLATWFHDISQNETAVTILSGIAAAIAGVASAIGLWNAAQAILNGLLSMSPITWIILGIVALIAAVVLLVTYWDEVKAWLLGVWEGIKQTAINIWTGIYNFFVDLWEGTLQFFKDIWNGLKEWASSIWNSISKVFSTIWNGIKTFFINLWNGIKTKVSTIWNSIKTTASNIWNGMKTAVTNIFNSIKTFFVNIWTNIKTKITDIVSGIKDTVSGIWDKLVSTTTNIFTSLKTTMANIWEGIKNAIKTPINGIIGFINGLVRGVVNGINGMIRALNKLHFSIPDWVPGLGGKSFGFNIGTLTAPQIPYLATGAVIPPNSPFLAVMGDQKRGQNIEAPAELIRQIVREEAGGGGNVTFTAQLNRRTIFEQTIEEAKLRQLRTGKNPFALA